MAFFNKLIEIIKKNNNEIILTRKQKLLVYMIITFIAILNSILYFCKIYQTIGYDFSSGVKTEIIVNYAPVSGIPGDLAWTVTASLLLNLFLIIVLNVLFFVKKDFTSGVLKALLVLLSASVLVSIFVFVIGAINPPKLK